MSFEERCVKLLRKTADRHARTAEEIAKYSDQRCRAYLWHTAVRDGLRGLAIDIQRGRVKS